MLQVFKAILRVSKPVVPKRGGLTGEELTDLSKNLLRAARKIPVSALIPQCTTGNTFHELKRQHPFYCILLINLAKSLRQPRIPFPPPQSEG